MGEESAAPYRFGVRRRTVDDGGGQTAHGTAPGVEEARLPREGLAVTYHPDDIPVTPSQPSTGDDGDLAAVAVDLGDRGSEAPRRGGEVHFRLDHDAAGNDVKPPGEPQEGGDLGFADRGLLDVEVRELLFDIGGQGHGFTPDSPQTCRYRRLRGAAGRGQACRSRLPLYRRQHGPPSPQLLPRTPRYLLRRTDRQARRRR